MWLGKCLLFFVCLATVFYRGDGCQMDGVSNWLLTITEEIKDTHRGSVFSRATTNIEATTISSSEGVDATLYLDVRLDGSNFIISTKDNYALYEENETSGTMSFSVNFRCTGGTTNTLVFDIQVIDTNNNAPIFKPDDVYKFTIMPPLPPGVQITGCGDDNIIVRDVDLTTERIIFEIQDNPYFEIAYNGPSTNPKEFLALLRTKDLIRTLPDVVELTIKATDVDQTGDPPITSTATVRIEADESFQFPEEPAFSQAFYLATYTAENQVVLEETITLRQGYHADVAFDLEGYEEYFKLVTNGNEITINVVTPLPKEVLNVGQLVLVIKATREHTSGDSVTVIVQLPEVLGLEFEQTHYEGMIVDNVLQPLQFNLKQGYEDGVEASIADSDHASFFSATVQGNAIILSMSPLTAQIIDDNNFITIQVIASNKYSSTAAVVTLEIIKDDSVTPEFQKALYEGEYDGSELTLEPITLVQGYDETVKFTITGDYAEYFEVGNDGSTVTLTNSEIPYEIWTEQRIYLTIAASKPRAVSATTVVSILLPAARQLSFQESSYSGTLQDNTLVHQDILLSAGYAKDVTFTLSGDYANYFKISPVENQVYISPNSLPDNVISENNFLTLTLSASGFHAISANTAVVLEIIKEDIATPVFTETIYRANYLEDGNIETGTISLAQGYDNSVTFRTEGEHAQYFQITNVDNNLELSVKSDIPAEVIFQEKVLIFNVIADKPLTVGGHAVIAVFFPEELTDSTVMRFSRNTYRGSYEENKLKLENIVLETGYESDTVFSLTGDYASYFTLRNTSNEITIEIGDVPIDEITDVNSLILLEIEAKRERAVSVSAAIVIDIIKVEITQPIFSEAYYRGVYFENELQFNDVISLAQGYDETVTFDLEGEQSAYFTIHENDDSITLGLNSDIPIPDVVLESQSQLLFTIVANKPGALSGTAAVSIDLPKDSPEAVIIRFTQSSYVGRIENGALSAPPITLLGDWGPLELNLAGDYNSYFEVSQDSNDVNIRLVDDLPAQEIVELSFIILNITASYPNAFSGTTAIVLEIIKGPQIVTPVLEYGYYIGEYSHQGLQFEQSIRLIQGFDETVTFTLAGDDAEWFEMVKVDENEFALSIKDSGLAQIKDRSHLIFSVVANKPDSPAARAAVIINLSDVLITVPLRFSRNFYTGTIDDGVLSLTTIVIEEGYSPDVKLTLTGEEDYHSYFQVSNQDGTITLQLAPELQDGIFDAYNVLVLSLEAQIDNTKTHTTVILELIKAEDKALLFEEAYYVGSYALINGFTFDPEITLTEKYDPAVLFSLEGDDSKWFDINITEGQNSVSLNLKAPIPIDEIGNRHQLIFNVVATRSDGVTAKSTIIVSIINDLPVLSFEKNTYLGTIENNAADIEAIRLTETQSESVEFTITGELKEYFTLTPEGASVTISLQGSVEDDLIPDNGIILLELQASASLAESAYTTIIFRVVKEDIVALDFSSTYYTGKYTEEEGLDFQDTIILIEGFDGDVKFALEGESADYFELEISDNSVTLKVSTAIPPAVIANNRNLIFTIQADKPNAITARAVIIISLLNEVSGDVFLGFDKVTYQGTIENGASELEEITLREGYSDEVSFTLHGDLKDYFSLTNSGAVVTVALSSPIPEQLLPNNRIVVLELRASVTDAMSAYAAIVFKIIEEETALVVLGFDKVTYQGTIENGASELEEITLREGYSDEVSFTLHGDLKDYFSSTNAGAVVTVSLSSPIPEQLLPNNRIVVLELRASATNAMSAYAAIVFKIIQEETALEQLQFSDTYYTGQYTEADGLTFESTMSLAEGYDTDVNFVLEGEYVAYFELERTENSVTLKVPTPIPPAVIANNRNLILTIRAEKPNAITARAVIIISLLNDSENGGLEPGAAFEKVLFEGQVQGGLAQHETIRISGYEGTNIQLFGAYEALFVASITDGVVTVQASDPLTPAEDIWYIALEMSAGDASAVLVLDVIHTEGPEPPTVSFASSSYSLKVDLRQSGLIGRVQATADNGETVAYSLVINDAHLQERISVNTDGELYLSAPANIGEYSFQVIATTLFSQASGTATVTLTVDAIAECTDSRALPPLTVVDRDEESAHRDLLLLNGLEYQGCTFSLTNRWPSEQSWLYLDETGLHAHAIDREHESIAFMALSQVQVELIMNCDTDNTRSKRSVSAESRLEHLGPYDYGDSTWLLGDTIAYNPRRGIVNLIVNDINDNAPIFIGKEQEPLIVAYPIAELEERILPRALAEVEATDADVGENAALVYWSTEEVLAVSPQTGFVHVKPNARLEDNAILTVKATDRNGQGLTGSLDIFVKLIDTNHIAVVTVQNAFLDDEKYIVGNLSASVGYDIKVLRATAISENMINEEADEVRSKREAILSTGATLQLYVYGLLQTQPVEVQRLTKDINVAETVIIADSISLEDHLENLQICPLPGRDIALLVSTIVLSCLLLILIVVTAVWFFLRWRKSLKYEQFSDENSIATRTDSPIPPPKPETLTKPRMNIDDLKKSERRLQEMLQTPDDVTIEPVAVQKPVESKINIPEAPIVIQSIDKLKDADDTDEDEFGERARDKRKSVVTFNENVEKIIHVEDPPEDPDFEVYKL